MVWAMPPDEFGAWGQWAGAIGSFLAVVVALWVAISDSRRRDRDREDQLSTQARSITTTCTAKFTNLGTPGDNWRIESFRVELLNHSSLPITNLSVAAVETYSLDDPLHEFKWARASSPQVVAPGTSVILFVEPFRIIETESPSEWRNSQVLVATVRFNDASGLRWRRTGTDPIEREVQALPRKRPTSTKRLRR
jgi:hypothetical protein